MVMEDLISHRRPDKGPAFATRTGYSLEDRLSSGV
jgi:hypothetical protein